MTRRKYNGIVSTAPYTQPASSPERSPLSFFSPPAPPPPSPKSPHPLPFLLFPFSSSPPRVVADGREKRKATPRGLGGD